MEACQATYSVIINLIIIYIDKNAGGKVDIKLMISDAWFPLFDNVGVYPDKEFSSLFAVFFSSCGSTLKRIIVIVVAAAWRKLVSIYVNFFHLFFAFADMDIIACIWVSHFWVFFLSVCRLTKSKSDFAPEIFALYFVQLGQFASEKNEVRGGDGTGKFFFADFSRMQLNNCYIMLFQSIIIEYRSRSESRSRWAYEMYHLHFSHS